MATTQITPENEAPQVELITVRKEVLDLDAKGEVTLVKAAQPPTPITDMADFVQRMNNDAAQILKYANVAFLEYYKDSLESNPDVPWQLADEDSDGNEVLVPWNGTLIHPTRVKSFNLSVMNLAKTLFGYAKKMKQDVDENRTAKKAAKAEAQKFILDNPTSATVLKTPLEE